MRWLARPFMLAALLAALLLPLWAASALAGDDAPPMECPEGLVYWPANDICTLPENIPAGEEQPAGEEPAGEAPPAEEPPAEEPPAEEPPAEEPPAEEPAGEAPPAGQTAAGDPVPLIANFTVLSFVCPLSWDPATRPIADSREMCSGNPNPPAVSYSILVDDTLLNYSLVGSHTDIARIFPPDRLMAGMWTIRQDADEGGIADPFAFCAIYDAAGNARLTVEETVVGGELDILLAEGEEVNCEWYMVRAAVTDPDGFTEPMGSTFWIDSRVCEYGITADLIFGEGRFDCATAQDADLRISASRLGSEDVFASAATGRFDLMAGRDTRLLSGTWRIEVALTDTYNAIHHECSVLDAENTGVGPPLQVSSSTVDVEVPPGLSLVCLVTLVDASPADGPTAGMNIVFNQCPEFFRETTGVGGECPPGLAAPVTVEAGRIVNGVPEAPVYVVPVPAGTTAPVRIAADNSMRSGEWYLRVVQPAGSLDPYWYPGCTGTRDDGAGQFAIEMLPPPDDANAAALLGPFHMLNCSAFLFAGSTSTSVAVNGRYCPDGYDPAASLDRETVCSPGLGWEVIVSVDGGEPQTTETQRNGYVVFPSQPGAWRIALPANTTQEREVGFVSCTQTIAALGTGSTIEPTLNGDRSFTIELDEGDGLLCDVYLREYDPAAVPAPTPTPETAPTDPTEPTPTPEPAAPMPTTAPAPTSQTTNLPPSGQTTNPPPAGQTINPPPAGQTINPPSGGTFGGGGSSSSSGTSSGTDTGTGETGTTDGDDPPSRLSIQHWVCAEPFGEATVDELIETCTASPDPSSWTLNGEPVEATSGAVEFPPLPPDLATVTNTTVGEGTESLVWCAVGPPGEEPLANVDVAVDGATIALVFDQGTAIACDWFVAPSPPEEGASALDRRSE